MKGCRDAYVVCAAWQKLGDLSPPVSVHFLGVNNSQVLLIRPRASFNVRIELVLVPLAALLSTAMLQVAADERPSFCPVLSDKLEDKIVFLWNKRASSSERPGRSMGCSEARSGTFHVALAETPQREYFHQISVRVKEI
jgi:hypothetical protein